MVFKEVTTLHNSFSTTSADYWDTTKTSRFADDLTDNTLADFLDVSTTTLNQYDLLYWDGSVWKDIATSSLHISTTNLTEGSKLFYTDGRVASYIK